MESAKNSGTSALLFEVKDHVAFLTLNRPEKRNALSRQLLTEFETLLAKIEPDPDIQVLVIGANGPVFCSGHDLSEMIGGHGRRVSTRGRLRSRDSGGAGDFRDSRRQDRALLHHAYGSVGSGDPRKAGARNASHR